MDFCASSELTGLYVDLTDSYEIWTKSSLVIDAPMCVRLLICDIPNTFPSMCSHVAKISKYSIHQVPNTFSAQPIGIFKKTLRTFVAITY